MSRCRSCGGELPEEATSCPQCGSALAETHDAALEMCEIVLWRGYVKSGFYAVPIQEDVDSAGEPPGSPLFRTKRGAPPAENGAARVAHDILVARLLAEGWEFAGRGSSWYALTFLRKHFSLAAGSPSPDIQAPSAELSAATTSADDETEWVPTEVVLPAPRPKLPARNMWRRTSVGAVFLIASTAGIAAAVAPSLLGSQPAEGHLPPAAVKSAKLEPRATKRAPAHAISLKKARVARVVIVAARGDSWLEARTGSSSGRVLYTGVLTQGLTTRVSAPRVWLRLAAASHLDILVNGKPPSGSPLMGTLEVVLGPNPS